jgi:hypothetical protein
MSRFLLLLIIGALAAMAIVYGLRTAQKTSSAAVTSLLPPETVAFAHIPDFNRTREQWHQSDIYQLYREPVIQDFLGKPLSRVPKAGSFSHTVRDLEQLDLKDGFVALTSMANDKAKIVAGFRFHGSQEDAEKVIGRWRSQLLANGPTTNHETLDYQQHKIDIATIGSKALATVYDGNWFLASSDVNELKAALDRVDGRSKDQKAALSADESLQVKARCSNKSAASAQRRGSKMEKCTTSFLWAYQNRKRMPIWRAVLSRSAREKHFFTWQV